MSAAFGCAAGQQRYRTTSGCLRPSRGLTIRRMCAVAAMADSPLPAIVTGSPSVRVQRRTALLVVAGLAAWIGSASGRDWIVTADRSGLAATIQSAIDSAADGDTVDVGSGTFYERIIVQNKTLLIRGQ